MLSPAQEYKSLLTTLYIGEHRHGLYALPGLVEKDTVPIIKSRESGGRLMIDGPHAHDGPRGHNVSPDVTQDIIEGEADVGGDRVEVVSQPDLIDSDDEDESHPPTTTATPGTAVVLVLGHHEIPERIRGKFSPHFGVIDDPHLTQRMKELELITQEAQKAVYPAIKNANDTAFPLLEGGGKGGNDGKHLPTVPATPAPATRWVTNHFFWAVHRVKKRS